MLNHKCDNVSYGGQLCTNRATKCITVCKKQRYWLFFSKYVFWGRYWYCDQHHEDQLEVLQIEEFYESVYKIEVENI